MTPPDCKSRMQAARLGALIGDALAMPVHWYYDRAALRRDYGRVRDFLAPKAFHPDSILWRSSYVPINEKGDILREQARFWGRRNVHYHQFLAAGENTVNLQLSLVLEQSIASIHRYDLAHYLESYIPFFLTPGMHNDTYLEEYHRHFFSRYALGKSPLQCGGKDIHIGGLAHIPAICAALWDRQEEAQEAILRHVGFSHASGEAVSSGAALGRTLFAIASGRDLREAILENCADWISEKKLRKWSSHPPETVVGAILSPACYLPDAFAASLYLACFFSESIEEGLICNTNLGGDNCHRGVVVGSLLGAGNGLQSIPSRWLTGRKASRIPDQRQE